MEEDALKRLRQYGAYLNNEISSRNNQLKIEDKRPHWVGQSELVRRVSESMGNFSSARAKLYHLFPELKPLEEPSINS